MKLLRVIKNFYESNLFFSGAVDFIATLPIYEFLTKIRMRAYIKKITKSKRYNIIIETTNVCNARCIMCPHIRMKRHQGIMTEEIFSTILKKIKKDNINPLCFILNGFGEPLIDSSIVERVKKIKKRFPSSVVKFYTNFSLASDKISRELILSGLDEINISFNGFDKESYEKVMGLDYRTTKNNLIKLIKIKNKLHGATKIRISMTLVSINQKSFDKFLSFWKGKVDSVSVNRVHTYGGSVGDVSGRLRINFKKKPYPCKYLWNTVVFDFEGNLVLCCLDYESKHKFGNIKNKGVLEMFYSDNFNAVREMHKQRNLEKLNMCKKCYAPYKNGVEWWIDNLY